MPRRTQIEKMKAKERGGIERQRLSGPDWSESCEVCGSKPVVPETGMCGPCTFGDASTVGGNW